MDRMDKTEGTGLTRLYESRVADTKSRDMLSNWPFTHRGIGPCVHQKSHARRALESQCTLSYLP